MTRLVRLLPGRLTKATLVALSLMLALIGFAPVSVLAEDCTPLQTAPTGVQEPTGADSATYTYNPCTGLWANDYYTWSPVTRQATPITPLVYVYSSASGKYEVKKWTYSPANGWYQATISVTTPPAGAKVIGAPLPEPPTTNEDNSDDAGSDSGGNDQAGQPSNGDNQLTADASSPSQLDLQSGAGASSSADGSSQTNTNTGLNDSNGVALNNTITATTTSGDAGVIANTTGGSATSGDATTSATVVNQVQSTSSLGGAVTFTANINGDVNGNLLIDPSKIQPAASDGSLKQPSNITVNSTNDTSINNQINLSSKSGDVTVSKNTQAGDATSGDATTIANVINLMNTLVSSGQSFIGTININGNLRGDILVPKDFYDTLVASNAPRQVVEVPNSTLEKSGLVVNNNQSITNTVNSTAVSGAATSSQNTVAGDATSGQAATNVTIFDLTNYQVEDSNSLLVFVNVTGKWVGVIMDAPAGSTAALFGSNVARGPPPTGSRQVNSSNTQSINNNINVAATSGDATVDKNTQAGDATSGNASTAVNLLNMTGSYFSTSNFFGILFINVFGNWYGNFGVAKPVLVPSSTSHHSSGGSSGKPTKKPAKTFKFEPAKSASSQNYQSGSTGDTDYTYYANHITPMLAVVSQSIPTTGSAAANAALRQASLMGASSVFFDPSQQNLNLSANSSDSTKPGSSGSDIAGAVLVLGGAVILGTERLSAWRAKRSR